MDPENPTEGVQPTGADVTPEGGTEAVTSTPQSPEGASALTLEEINAITGKSYKDKATALKSIKDMSSMAGKAADQAGRGAKPDDDRIRALEQEVFYARNPEHEANKEIIEALAKANGLSIKEAVELPAYKTVLERTKGAETPQRRTVVEPQSRSGSVVDDATKAKASALKSGDPLEMAKFVVQHHMN